MCDLVDEKQILCHRTQEESVNNDVTHRSRDTSPSLMRGPTLTLTLTLTLKTMVVMELQAAAIWMLLLSTSTRM